MIKQIHCFGSSFTEGGGFEWWKYEEVKYIYKPYIGEYTSEKTSFPFSWPGQLKKLIDGSHQKLKGDYVHNYGRCGWGNERTYRKIWEIVSKPTFNPKEHLFLIEFSDTSRASFWSVEKQKHFLVNYDMGEPDREGLLYKQDVEPVFDYHRKTFAGEEQYLNGIAPMMTEFLKCTHDEGDVLRRVEQNQITFVSWMKEMDLNFLVPLPNAFCYKPMWHDRLFKFRVVGGSTGSCGHQYDIPQMGYGFGKETHGIWNDFHGGLAWSEMIAMKVYNLMIDWNFISKEPLDISPKNLERRKLKIRNEIKERLPEIREFYNELEGFRRRGGIPILTYHKNLI